MYGHTVFKSHVLRRDEKGIFGIPFKRLLGCGLGTGALFTGLRLALPDYAFIISAVTFLALLFLTTPSGGVARWRHIALGVQWQLLSAVTITPNSAAGQMGRAFGLPAGQIDLDAETLFKNNEDEAPRTTLTDWVSFSSPSAANNSGLTFIATPGLALHGGAS